MSDQSTLSIAEIGGVLVCSSEFFDLWMRFEELYSATEVIERGAQILEFVIEGDKSYTEVWTAEPDPDGDLGWGSRGPCSDNS